jgi:hypothetical protein
MRVEPAKVHGCDSAALHVEHGVQLLQYLEAVHELCTAGFNVCAFDGGGGAPEVSCQRVIESDDQTDG